MSTHTIGNRGRNVQNYHLPPDAPFIWFPVVKQEGFVCFDISLDICLLELFPLFILVNIQNHT